MTLPDIQFPDSSPDQAHIECVRGSQRLPDESLAQPCHVCGHFACRIGPQGPVPCESCTLHAMIRQAYDPGAGDPSSLVARVENRLDALDQQVALLFAEVELLKQAGA